METINPINYNQIKCSDPRAKKNTHTSPELAHFTVVLTAADEYFTTNIASILFNILTSTTPI